MSWDTFSGIEVVVGIFLEVLILVPRLFDRIESLAIALLELVACLFEEHSKAVHPVVEILSQDKWLALFALVFKAVDCIDLTVEADQAYGRLEE